MSNLNPDGISGWPVLLGEGAEPITRARGHIDRTNGKVEHTVDISPHRGWFQWRSRPRRLKREAGDGSRMIATALALLFVLAGGLLGVSYAAQFVMIVKQRHGQILASNVEALSADCALMIFSLLALGLARKGLNSIMARWGVVLMAGLSAAMNYAAANGGDWRSVLTYCGPSILLAFVVDTTVSVIKRHYLGMRDDASPFRQLARVLARVLRFLAIITLYALRLFLAPIETPKGLRRMVLNATPLPEPEPIKVRVVPVRPRPVKSGSNPKAIGGPRGPRPDSKATKLVAAVEAKYGPLAQFPIDRVSAVCAELAPTVGMDAGWARTVLRKAVLAAHEGQEEAS